MNPQASEVWYDDIDGDCDGGSDYDADGDGEDAAEYGGADCDDADPSTALGDADGDGALVCLGDCDDQDAAVHPAATPVCGNEVDDDCDGQSDCALGRDVDPELDSYGSVAGAEGGDQIGGWALLVPGDLDDDGAVDFLVGSANVDRVWLTSPPVAGAETLATADLVWDIPVDTMAVGDVNGDGVLDAVIGSERLFDFAGARLFHGPLAQQPLPDAEISSDFSGGVVAVGDLDGVGAADIALGFQEWGVHVYASPIPASAGLAEAHAFLDLGANSGTLMFSDDLTGDGVGDLLVGTSVGSDMVRLFSGPLPAGTTPADAAFASLSSVDNPELRGMEWLSSQTGDVDGDGHDDLLLGGAGPSSGQLGGAGMVFSGPLMGTLGYEDAAGTILPHAWMPYATSAVGVGDIDGDGFADCGIHGLDFGADIAYGPIVGTVDTATTGMRIVAADPNWIAGTLHQVPDLTGDGQTEIAFATQQYPLGAGLGSLNPGIIWLLEGSAPGGW